MKRTEVLIHKSFVVVWMAADSQLRIRDKEGLCHRPHPQPRPAQRKQSRQEAIGENS